MRKKDYIAFSVTKHIRISPYKLRKVADVVRGMDVDLALNMLNVMNQKGASIIYKALHSAKSNAVNVKKANKDDLVLSAIIVDEAGSLKRMNPRARGRAFSIKKRLSHIKIGLNKNSGDKNGSKG